jgi:predicted enzyme related to lactoylglutathione lyase
MMRLATTRRGGRPDMNVHHTIDYIEITVHDVAEAKAFYTAAFGWAFNDYGSDYAGIVGGDGEVGGLTQGETHPGGPLVVI